MEETKKSWRESKKIIKKNISFQAYQTWFSGLQIISVDYESITLQVPNRFHYEWIDSKYGELIKSATKKCFGKEMGVNYSVIVQHEQQSSEVLQKIDKLIPTLEEMHFTIDEKLQRELTRNWLH